MMIFILVLNKYHEVLVEDRKKYGISRVTNKEVYSISFDIVF